MAFVASRELRADGNEIIGLEALVAAAWDGGPIYSRFGHTLLRFVKADGNFSTDPVVSMEADVPANQVDLLKGLDGAYRVIPTASTFGSYWSRYVSIDERPIERYIIPSTPEMRTALLTTLDAWIRNPKLDGHYTFLDNNCAGALANLLEAAGFPSTIGFNPIIPTDIDNWLKHSLLSFYPMLEMQSPKPLYDKASGLLKIPTSDFTAGLNWPADSADVLSKNLSDLEIKKILLDLTTVPGSTRTVLSASHNFVNGGATFEQAMSFQAVPKELYQVCTDASCMSALVSAVKSLWTPKQIKGAIDTDSFVYSLVNGSEDDTSNDPALGLVPAEPETFDEPISNFPKNLRKVPALIQHDQLFLKAMSSGS